jgi:hypothetical protein
MTRSDYNMMNQTAEGQVEAPLLFDNTGCSGRVKLMQRVMVLLLRESGSSPDSTIGTMLPNFATGANTLSKSEMDNQCAIAAARVSTVIKAEQAELTDVPDDELLDKIVASVAASADRTSYNLTVNIITASGAAAAATTAVPVV